MINIKELEFKQLDLEGLEILVKWAAEEGWNPGFQDAKIFWQTDPEAFYGYYRGQELVAGGAVVSYDKMFGFMGLFIVRKDIRSLGIGRELWYQRRDLLLSRLYEGASIGMDGVLAMQPFYNKGGFEIAFRDERHEKTGARFDLDQHISSITEKDFDAVLAYDLRCFGFARSRFLIPWLKQQNAKTFKYSEQGQLKGFAMIRRAMKGYKVCPLFADNAEVAEKLYQACLNAVPGQSLFIDIPMINADAVELIRKYKTNYVFECARMYFGQQPDLDINRVFGITTFELG